MDTRNNHIINELLEVAPQLAAVGNRTPYGVPNGYFDEFASTMLWQVKANRNDEVPAGYFDQFAIRMLQKVRGNEVREELEAVSPFLNNLPKTMPHTLPEGYFEQWQPKIPGQKEHQPAKVISLGSAKHWKQWAAAAVILFTMGISWQLWVNKGDQSTYTAATSPAVVDTLLTGIDAGSLTDYLEDSQANSTFSSLLLIAQQDVETGVAQLSDEELKWYLENQAVEIPGT